MFDLRTLGELTLTAEDGRRVRSVLAQPKRVALLAYLVSPATPDFVPRATLVGLLWGERDEEHARGALRSSLYFLRRSLGSDVILAPTDLVVGVDPERLRCDVRELEAALDAGELAKALDLYGGEYLAGLGAVGSVAFERWLEGERRRLARRARRAARSLASAALERGEPAEAERRARWALRIDPWDEEALRLLLGALSARGQAAEARRTYDRFAARLEEEMDLEPSPLTRETAERLGGGEGSEREGGGGAGARAPVAREGREASAAAKAAADPVSPTPERPGATDETRSSPSSAWRRPAVTALAVVLVGASILYLARRAGSGPRRAAAEVGPAGDASLPPNPASVAILPFQLLGGSPGDRYLAAGLATDLEVRLARAGGLRVVGPEWVEASPDSSPSPAELARRLNVRLLLFGTVQRGEHRIHVTARLVEPRTDRTVWAGTYDRPQEQLLTLQADIADQIAGATTDRLRDEQQGRLRRSGTTSAAAWDLFARGNYLADQAATGPERMRADSLVLRALAIDPRFAAALAIHASILARAGVARDSVVKLARRAVQLGPDDYATHLQLGNILVDPRHRIAAYLRSLRLEPAGGPTALHIAAAYGELGRYDLQTLWYERELAEMPFRGRFFYLRGFGHWLLGDRPAAEHWLCERAGLTPEDPYSAANCAQFYLSIGAYRKARATIRREIERRPDSHFALPVAGDVELYAGRYRDAVRYYHRALAAGARDAYWGTVEPSRASLLTPLGFAYLRTGRADTARRLLGKARRMEERTMRGPDANKYVAYDLARIASVTGDTAGARRWLQTALGRGWNYVYTFWGDRDPMLARVRGAPWFVQAMDTIRVEVDRQRRRVLSIPVPLPDSVYRRMLHEADSLTAGLSSEAAPAG